VNSRRLDRLWLAAGAFGGEVLLLVSLPWLGRLHGPEQVAWLGVAIVVANAGKLLAPLKLDAALTNAQDDELGTTHVLAAGAIACSTTVAAAAALVSFAAGWRFEGAGSLAFWLVVSFGAGGVQQACTMRLLRESRLGWYAVMKSLPPVLMVPAAGWLLDWSLPAIYAIAAVGTTLAAAALHLRPVRLGTAARAALARRLRSCRPYAVHGAPAAALDALNMLLLSLLTIGVAGAVVAGEATQVQRMALGISLAVGLLIGQDLWRRRFNEPRETRVAFRRTLLVMSAAGLCSVLISLALVATPASGIVFAPPPADPILLLACLAPLLAQYTGSPLTVLFFKRDRMGLYALLQLTVLASLAGATLLHSLGVHAVAVLLGLATVTVGCTAATARLAAAD
jgi:hypothetical protein